MGGKLTQGFVTKSVEFCLHAFDDIAPEDRQVVLAKLDSVKADANKAETTEDLRKLNEDELIMLRTIRARQALRTEDMMNIDNFSHEAVDGFSPRLIRGRLGLAKVANSEAAPVYSEGLFDAIPNMDATVTNINSTVGPEGPILAGEARA